MCEGGRHQPAPAQMLLSLAVEQTVAQQRTRKNFKHGPFFELVGAVDQNLLDQIRRVEENDIDASETGAADARNLRSQPFQHADSAAEKRADRLDQPGHITMLAVLA